MGPAAPSVIWFWNTYICRFDDGRIDMNTSFLEVSRVMFAQGFIGCLWVPATLVTFSNLALDRSAEGAMMWNLVRVLRLVFIFP